MRCGRDQKSKTRRNLFEVVPKIGNGKEKEERRGGGDERGRRETIREKKTAWTVGGRERGGGVEGGKEGKSRAKGTKMQNMAAVVPMEV
ncbi:hypothetical protein EYF80_052121 [Liparis tanakae]|uniref:Uncharacterized protein n=1 Tax=Liparis tanakae TaxID=230148 RepID=A0A4Z2F9Y0_9TELE|nr:hypothetical protein EYF80_052121 [Liparis tanakae]